MLSVVVLATASIGASVAEADDGHSVDAATPIASVNVEIKKEDSNEKCSEWAESGECESNPDYMLESCPTSCAAPPTIRTAVIMNGQDFATGAIQFAEDYGIQDISEILSTAEKLREASTEYSPPQELTHCTSPGKPTKPCTAGKLWKRAEDLRKADIHDEVAADLVRILLKSGIEVDFVEKAQRSLSWALQSIQRQRERERKEAEEEAKLEKRRQEELMAMEEAAERKKAYENDFVSFFTSAVVSGDNGQAEASIDADGSISEEQENLNLIKQVKESFTGSTDTIESCGLALQLTKKIPLGNKSVEVLLVEARCLELQGKYKNAMSAAGKLINKASTYGSLSNDSVSLNSAE